MIASDLVDALINTVHEFPRVLHLPAFRQMLLSSGSVPDAAKEGAPIRGPDTKAIMPGFKALQKARCASGRGCAALGPEPDPSRSVPTSFRVSVHTRGRCHGAQASGGDRSNACRWLSSFTLLLLARQCVRAAANATRRPARPT